ncbi:hypothetical protein K438DRAFT_1825085 [Mycena galopus ATCC 62051]|nr:hypothetical protein K438DRAFT_1825085 [Mycena galopus ATCC 62051]
MLYGALWATRDEPLFVSTTFPPLASLRSLPPYLVHLKCDYSALKQPQTSSNTQSSFAQASWKVPRAQVATPTHLPSCFSPFGTCRCSRTLGFSL